MAGRLAPVPSREGDVPAREGDTPAREGDSGSRAAGLAPRLALLVVTVVFAGFVVNAVQYVVATRATLGHIAPAAFCLVVMMVLQLGLFSDPRADVRGRWGHVALLAQAVVVLAPLAFYGRGWTGMQGFLAGDALLVLRPLAGWPVFGVIALATGLVQYEISGVPAEAVYITNLTVVIGLVVYGLSRLRSLVRELDEARSELADLAVARERLRFARDLHDLLGFSLSAVTLKTDLARRLLPRDPSRARRELAEILGVSRQALSDVRAVASSYRELSLDDEMASARSVLTAAEVVVTVEYERGDLPPRIRTVLATVLREGVTNLLRHSEAGSCGVTVARDEATVSIEIVNDGVRDMGDPGGHGDGIGNLRSRVEAVGGTLTAGAGPEETYRLRAVVPLRDEDEKNNGDDGGDVLAAGSWRERRGQRGQRGRPGRPGHGPAMAPRLGLAVATAVFTGYAVNATVFVATARMSLGDTFVAEACVLVSLGLVLGFFSRPAARVRSPLGYALLAAQAVVTYLPVALFENPYLGLPGLLAGSLLLTLPTRFGLPLFLAVMVSVGGAHSLLGGDSIGVTYGFLVTVNHGLVVFALSRLRSMVQDLHDARSGLADLAVTRERLRFARDLHDLLGFSLSAVTLKAELTHRLLSRDPSRAHRELSEILDISRQALSDVRAVASSYRGPSLDDEIASARALLTSMDIDVTLRLEPCAPTPDVRTTLAMVLREGVANLLRHSGAENCEITLTCRDDLLTMRIVNDGVLPADGAAGDRPVASANGSGGSGIRDLTVRVSGMGGTLRAGTTAGDTYRLQAEIPLTRA
ncbi:sensor histidine kinase [Streptosporangium sp. V21-05]|uniref:sensor histidine kinase n=1 Tax=Streptosporangium sp. V21-05 TaxID=3446115 RepID=UPI003F52CF94